MAVGHRRTLCIVETSCALEGRAVCRDTLAADVAFACVSGAIEIFGLRAVEWHWWCRGACPCDAFDDGVSDVLVPGQSSKEDTYQINTANTRGRRGQQLEIALLI